jgi:hypothetical protein
MVKLMSLDSTRPESNRQFTRSVTVFLDFCTIIDRANAAAIDNLTAGNFHAQRVDVVVMAGAGLAAQIGSFEHEGTPRPREPDSNGTAAPPKASSQTMQQRCAMPQPPPPSSATEIGKTTGSRQVLAHASPLPAL